MNKFVIWFKNRIKPNKYTRTAEINGSPCIKYFMKVLTYFIDSCIASVIGTISPCHINAFAEMFVISDGNDIVPSPLYSELLSNSGTKLLTDTRTPFRYKAT